MAGLAPAISIGKARGLSARDHRHKAGDDVRWMTLESNPSLHRLFVFLSKQITR
jgi:hypothetical protein